MFDKTLKSYVGYIALKEQNIFSMFKTFKETRILFHSRPKKSFLSNPLTLHTKFENNTGKGEGTYIPLYPQGIL